MLPENPTGEHLGVGHITLTVVDVDRSVAFYTALFGGAVRHAGEDAIGPFAVVDGPGVRLGFRRHRTTRADDRFAPDRVGLDHLAVHVADVTRLLAWRDRLDRLGARHSGIVEDAWGHHLNAEDPDGIALEFHSPSTPDQSTVDGVDNRNAPVRSSPDVRQSEACPTENACAPPSARTPLATTEPVPPTHRSWWPT
ncbi:VOC family protein [Saccharothrix obliqua]|uniref:VOC family protein n=1 Tax=Saccharothrix obliqua TaxID=2861747 RepID=UPI001C5E77B0|nr:VOC family protein [Saccharothrix obliqua]MBW4719971.1 VOC family protein [Saccharothrix obliqua]